MAPPPSGDQRTRKTRKLRNFLLDVPVQMRFASRLVSVTVLVAGALLVGLALTSQSLFKQINNSLDAQSMVVLTNQELEICRTNTQLAAPEAQANPDELTRIQRASHERHAILVKEQEAAIEFGKNVISGQRLLIFEMIILVVSFVVIITLLSIVWTHRIVGPLYRLKQLMRDITEGRPPTGPTTLRNGDELKDVFEQFTTMMKALDDFTKSDLAELDAAKRGDAAALSRIESRLKKRLGLEPSSGGTAT